MVTFAYQEVAGRDLRLDFLRGLIMLTLISIHMEYFSLFSMIAWESVGIVSSAAGFVALSGIVIGMVYRKRLSRDGFKSAALRLLQRSLQLYSVNIAVILSIMLLRFVPFIDVYEVTHWAPIFAPDQAVALYPPFGTPWGEILQQALLLRMGPHQFQIIGLYVVLLALAPIALYSLHKRQAFGLLALSWGIYGLNHFLHISITGANFERAFPALTWQLLFIHGMVFGYHYNTISNYLLSKNGKPIIVLASVLSLFFLFMTWNNPGKVFWPWHTLSYIDPQSFRTLYDLWFRKNNLGLGRILNNMTLFIVLYYLLTHYWRIFNSALGWLVVPLGQASLYVFTVHVYFIILFSNTPLPGYKNFVLNTLMHATTILLIWAMVKHRVLFRIIPR